MSEIKIMSWNIACLPNYINSFANVEKRLPDIIRFIEIHNPDIISLQEVFSSNCKKVLKDFFETRNYNVIISPNTKFLLNGGLLIATKYDILSYEYKIYKNYIGEDGLCQKGILNCQIKYNDIYINIFNTHLNNDDPLVYSNSNTIPLVKKKQLTEFLIHFNKTLQNNKYLICEKYNVMSIITGDFNLKFKSKLYNIFMKKLSKNVQLCSNKSEIITDIIEKNQIDYIINCYNKHTTKKQSEYVYNYSTIYKLSDHYPLIKKCLL